MLRESHMAAMALAWKVSAGSPLDRARVEKEEPGTREDAVTSTVVETTKDSDLPFFYFPTLRLFLGLR